MTTYSFQRLIMRKSEIGISVESFGIFELLFTFFLFIYILFECLLSSPQRGKFSINYSKFFFSGTIKRMKLKLGMHSYDNTVYKSYVLFIFSVRLLSLLWQLKVSIDI